MEQAEFKLIERFLDENKELRERVQELERASSERWKEYNLRTAAEKEVKLLLGLLKPKQLAAFEALKVQK